MLVKVSEEALSVMYVAVRDDIQHNALVKLDGLLHQLFVR